MLWFTLCGTLAGPSALLFRMHHNGFDSSASHAFSQFLRRLRERGVTIFMATHDLFRAKEDATRVGIMRAGRLVHEFFGPARPQPSAGPSCLGPLPAISPSENSRPFTPIRGSPSSASFSRRL